MARKTKAVRPKAEGKSQVERFVETARRIGADESGEAFERAFEKIVPPRRLIPPEAGTAPGGEASRSPGKRRGERA